MGLYLCVFADDETDDELEGVEVGGYDDFDGLRQQIADRLEGGAWGSRFPLLMNHHDADGTWGVAVLADLETELATIAAEFRRQPPVAFPAGWQTEVARALGLSPVSLADSFVDVDGEPLLVRLIELVQVARGHAVPLWFQ